MGYRIEDDCVGCDYCRGCGRKHIKIHYCDICEEDVNELFYDANGKEVCWDCFKEQYEQRICDEDDITQCSNCGSADEILYGMEGEWICEACMMDLADKVEDWDA